jgi:acetyltransferase-like isoleucine patch superfamily enzyme
MSLRQEIRSILELEYGLTPSSLAAISKTRRISADVKIGSGVEVGEDVIIQESVEIGDGVQIGNRVTLRNCRLGDGVRIEDNCIIGYQTLTGGFSHKFEERKQVQPTVIGGETLVRAGSIIYQSVTVGESCWINHCVMLREHTRIGAHTCIGTMSESEGYNTIGSHVLIHSQVHMCARMTIEDYVFVAPFTVFTNGNPMNYARDISSREEGPVIQFGTQIAVNVVVLPRVVVGYESLIGASALVAKDVPALGIVLGVPGKVVGRVPGHLRMPEAIRKEYYGGKLDPDVEIASANGEQA